MIVQENFCYAKYGVSLQPIKSEQIEMVRSWRNRADIREKMLTRDEITTEQQLKWFNAIGKADNLVYFVAFFKALPIGVASAINIDPERKFCEPGMYIAEPKYQGNIVPFCVAFALNDFLFEELRLRVLNGKVFKSNNESMRFHLACGYQVVEDSSDLVRLELNKKNYIEARDKVARFIRY